MKKYILSILSLLFLNTTYSQVLYDDNFDNYTLGNLGTDPNGVTPGQGGWLTKDGSKNNSCFTITAEPGRGKVLTLSTIDTISQHTPTVEAVKTGLNTLVDQRIPGNNIIKLEIDYYTGSQHPGSNNSNNQINLIDENKNHLVNWSLSPTGGNASSSILNGNGNNRNHLKIDNGTSNSMNPLPFNTWVTFIAYLDYNNKKAYFETPYFGTVVAGDFLDQSNSTNLIEDFKPSKIRLYIINQAANILKHQMVNKYDNIKITALNAVPPHILSVNTVLAESFNLYPNPATNMVNITNGENHLVNQVVIYDVAGKELSTQMFNNEAEIQLNVRNLTSGVYMLHIQTNAGTAVKKLVKK